VSTTYPMSITDQRELPGNYSGNVFVWDVDKTYLSTRFSSPRHLLRIPLEFAVDKREVPGMPQVLRGLRRGTSTEYASVPLYFVSASPAQLRPVLERKMLMDGVEYDGIILKDWVGVLRQLRPHRLKDHVAFKLCALLAGRRKHPMACEWLFGDDVEADARVFALYSKLLRERPTVSQLGTMLRAEGLTDEDVAAVFEACAGLAAKVGSVGGSFIHLARSRPVQEVESVGEGVVAVRDALQLALALFDRGLVDARTVQHTAAAMTERGSAPVEQMVRDTIERGLLSSDRAEQAGFSAH